MSDEFDGAPERLDAAGQSILYGRQKLAERPAAPVMVCEGKAAADAASVLLPTIVTIASPKRSKGVRCVDWAPLSGRQVIIWPNAGAEGLEHALAVANEASIASAMAVAIISPPTGCKADWNAADAQAEGWSTERAGELAAAAYNWEDYPHRKRRLRQRDASAGELIDQLHRLEQETHPKDGLKSANRKDLRAFEALDVAGQLIDALAGWALDHQVGLALKNLKFVPLQPSGTKQHPDYLKVDERLMIISMRKTEARASR